MQFTPLGPWGVGASAGPATEGLKGDSGRVADRYPLEGDTRGKGVNDTQVTAVLQRVQPEGSMVRRWCPKCEHGTARKDGTVN